MTPSSTVVQKAFSSAPMNERARTANSDSVAIAVRAPCAITTEVVEIT
ncbi:hypothetical protein [Microbacterium flavum]|nr:hypothetical protein [Microbacterium flavum]